MSSAAPASFPTELRTLTQAGNSADVQVIDPKNTLLDTSDEVNTVKVRNPTGNLGEGATCLAAQIYTGKSNEFIMDVSGLISGAAHTIAFTDKNVANVPYSAKNKIDTIIFTPQFTLDANGIVTRTGGTTGAFNSSSGHADVCMNIIGTGVIPEAQKGAGLARGLFDTARITVKDRVNVYDGAVMQLVMTNGSNSNKLQATSATDTPPPFLINGGPGDAPQFTVRIDPSNDSMVAGTAATPTTGVVSLDFGGKIAGKGIDVSSIVVNYTDSTSLSFTTKTLATVQARDLYIGDTGDKVTFNINQKKITQDMLDSGVLPGMFEITNANDKTYEFSAQYVDKAGVSGKTGGATSMGIMSKEASAISSLTMNGRDRTNYASALYASVNTKNNGLGGRIDVSWTAPTYLPSAVVGYKIYWLSGATDLSNNLNFPSTGKDANDAANRGKWRWLHATAKAKGQFFETTGTATTARLSLPNSGITAAPYTDVSRQYYFFPVAITLDSAGNKVEGAVANSGIVDATNLDATNSDAGAGRAIEGCPSAPTAYKIVSGKDLVAAGTTPNKKMADLITNRMKVAYYDDKVDQRGAALTQGKAFVVRTKDVRYLPSVIADGSYNLDVSLSNVLKNGAAGLAKISDGIDIIDLSNILIDTTDLNTRKIQTDSILTDYYDDVSGVWKLTHGGTSAAAAGGRLQTNDNFVDAQGLFNDESYTVYLKLGNRNGYSLNERSSGKSGKISTFPNIRAWGMPMTVSENDATGFTSANKQPVGKLLGYLNRYVSSGTNTFPAPDASNVYHGTNNENVVANVARTAVNFATVDLPTFPASAPAGTTLTANTTVGFKDTSFGLVEDQAVTLKWSEKPLDISAGYFENPAEETRFGSNLDKTPSREGVSVVSIQPGASRDVASGGEDITYLKYQVHTTYINGAGATTNVDTAAKRFTRGDSKYLERLGPIDTPAADAEYEYMSNFDSSVHFSTDICGGHFRAVNTTSTGGTADGNATDEHAQKTIQVPYTKGTGKLKIAHYYDASGNPQKLKNGHPYRIKLWGGNANGDVSYNDVSFANVIALGTPESPTDFSLSGVQTITAGRTGAAATTYGRRYKAIFTLKDIYGVKQGKGQFYQKYHVKAEQTIAGATRIIGQAEKLITSPNSGETIILDVSNASTNTSATTTLENKDAFYGYPVTVTVTPLKNAAADSDTTNVTTLTSEAVTNGTAVTTDGAFGLKGKPSVTLSDCSGASIVKVFDLPMQSDSNTNEVPYVKAVSGDKKTTITWAPPTTNALYIPSNGEAATSILGYSVYLYDASNGSIAADKFNNLKRRVQPVAVKNIAHTGGELSTQFDGLLNGKIYIPRITTTYAYGPIGLRQSTTTEGAYLGFTNVATSAAPTPHTNIPGFLELPDIGYADDTALVDGTNATVPKGLPVISATARTGGNELVIDDNGSNLTQGVMLQINPAPTGNGTSVFSYTLTTAGTTTNFYPHNAHRKIRKIPNASLGNNWNDEINYLFVQNKAGTTVAVTNLDPANLGDNVVKL
jgi:hypothetical protein